MERVEGSRNSQLAREVEIALPKELTVEENISLAREYVQKNFVDKGMVADLCIHLADSDDANGAKIPGGNPHAHVMLTLRPIEKDGSWGAKSRKEYVLDKRGERIRLPSGEYKSRKICAVDWNEQTKADVWREAWGKMANEYLAKNGFEPTLDHRSYERQGLDVLPSVHLGVAASGMERKGIVTDRGNHNRQVSEINKELSQTLVRIKKQKVWLYSQPLVDTPSLMDTMNAIADSKNLDTYWQRTRNLQTRGKVLVFLGNNGIGDFSQLVGMVEKLHKDFQDVSDNIKAKERRLNTLAEHLAWCEIHILCKATYKKYRELPRNKQDAYYDKHRDEIRKYQDSKAYFDKVMKGRDADGNKTTEGNKDSVDTRVTKSLPIKRWQKEQKKLLTERFALVERYYSIKEDLRSVEQLQRGAEKLMKDAATATKREMTSAKTSEMEAV